MMQQSLPKPFHYAGKKTTPPLCRCARVLDRIDHALEQVDGLAVRCLKAIGRAYLDGVIAYGAAMHGFSHPTEEIPPAAPPADAPIWTGLSETWLNQSPRHEFPLRNDPGFVWNMDASTPEASIEQNNHYRRSAIP